MIEYFEFELKVHHYKKIVQMMETKSEFLTGMFSQIRQKYRIFVGSSFRPIYFKSPEIFRP